MVGEGGCPLELEKLEEGMLSDCKAVIKAQARASSSLR